MVAGDSQAILAQWDTTGDGGCRVLRDYGRPWRGTITLSIHSSHGPSRGLAICHLRVLLFEAETLLVGDARVHALLLPPVFPELPLLLGLPTCNRPNVLQVFRILLAASKLSRI